jgi:WD40 repeat protein
MTDTRSSMGGSRRYPGARSFEDGENYRRLFFGRERETVRLRNQVLADDLVVVFGESGYGKSSLLKAGLMEPLRRRGYFPVMCRAYDQKLDPISTVYATYRNEAESTAFDYVHGDEISLWHFFKTQELWSGPTLLKPVLIIDQFEELFTLNTKKDREAFIDQLVHLVRGHPPVGWQDNPGRVRSHRPPKVKVVLSLRSDSLAELEALSDRLPQILRSRFMLGPLGREEAGEAIEAPGRYEGDGSGDLDSEPFDWDPAALKDVLDYLCERRTHEGAVIGGEVDPSQLQLISYHVESEVIKKQKVGAGSLVTPDIVGDRSRLKRVQRTFYRKTLWAVASQGTSNPFKILWRAWCCARLCEVGLISGHRRIPMEESDIKRRHYVDRETLASLVDKRLVRMDARKGHSNYELSHDTLVTPIRDARRVRNAWIIRVAASLLLVLGGSLLATWFQGREARWDRDRLAAAEAAYYQLNDPASAALLLREVVRPGEGWRRMVTEVFSSPFPVWVSKVHESGIRDVDVSAARTLVTGAEDGAVTIWDLTGNPQRQDSLPGGEGSVARVVATAGDFVAWGSSAGEVHLWRRSEGGPPQEIATHRAAVRGLALTEEGHVASVSSDSTLHLRWPEPEQEPVTLELPEPLDQVAISDRDRILGVRFLAAAGRSGTIYRWPLGAGGVGHRRPVEPFAPANLPADTDFRIRSLEYEPGGGALLVVSRSLGALLLREGYEEGVVGLARGVIPRRTNDVASASFDPSGKYLVLVQRDGLVRVVEGDGGVRWASQAAVAELEHRGSGRPVAALLAEANDSDSVPRLATAWSDGAIRVWSAFDREDYVTRAPPPAGGGIGDVVFYLPNLDYTEIAHARLTGLDLSPDGRWLTTVGSEGMVMDWNLEGLSSSLLLQPVLVPGGRPSVVIPARPGGSPDAPYLTEVDGGQAAVFPSGIARDTVSGPPDSLSSATVTLPGPPGSLPSSSVALAGPPDTLVRRPDTLRNVVALFETGDSAVIVTRDSIVVFDIGTRVVSRMREGREDSIRLAVEAPGGGLVVVTGDALQLWRRSPDWSLTDSIPGDFVHVDLSKPDTLLLWSQAQESVQAWTRSVVDPANPDAVWTSSFVRPDPPAGVVPPRRVESPDGRHILIAKGDPGAFSVYLGQLDSVGVVKDSILLGNEASANMATFNADWSKVLVGLWDMTLVHDVTTGREVSLRSRAGQVRTARFAPGGEAIVTTSEFGAQLWDPVDGVYPAGPTLSIKVDFPLSDAAFGPGQQRIYLWGAGVADRVWEWPIAIQSLRATLSGVMQGRCLDEEIRRLVGAPRPRSRVAGCPAS